MLEESNETIFQMKDAMYFFIKELQLNMDNWLKSHVIARGTLQLLSYFNVFYSS